MSRPLSSEQRKSLVRAIGVGVPLAELAREYGLSVSSLMAIDRVEQRRKRVRTREAEPLPAPKTPDWKTARPAAEMYLPSDGCMWPGEEACGAPRVHGKPYCTSHCAVAFPRFRAEAA